MPVLTEPTDCSRMTRTKDLIKKTKLENLY